jgi:SAM-dependent methyltransferase
MLPPLVCPGCHGELHFGAACAECAACGARYPVDAGLPLLTGGDTGEHARAQAAGHDHAVAPEVEIERPRRTPSVHGWLAVERFRRSVAGIEGLLGGARAAVVCSGPGADAELLARAGARPLAFDVSPGAARRARERFRRRGIEAGAAVALAERLPLADRAVEIAYVHDGLHHLEDPLAGLREMARVAGRAVIVSEPTDSPVTRLAVRAGVATDTEDAGNRVARIDPRAAARELRAAGFTEVRTSRYAMHYDPGVGHLARAMSRRRLAPAARAAVRALATAGAPVGNKLVIQALRPSGTVASRG